MDLGATLLSIEVPDRHEGAANVLVGADRPNRHVAGGASGPDARMGATCGRVANRIAGAAYVIDRVRHALVANEGANQLHGGPNGFDRRCWAIEHADARELRLALVSPDGDQGHPGELHASARFLIGGVGELHIVYEATTDRPTHVNLVSHPYLNLSGRSSSVLDHRLTVAAAAFLPIAANGLPLGILADVAETPFDFRQPRAIGERIDAPDPQIRAGAGYNHNFALSGGGLRDVATLTDPASGRRLRIATDQPGLQLYSANALCDRYTPRTAVCLETQGWPDAANQPDFPTTRLNPGAVYRSETRLRFDVG